MVSCCCCTTCMQYTSAINEVTHRHFYILIRRKMYCIFITTHSYILTKYFILWYFIDPENIMLTKQWHECHHLVSMIFFLSMKYLKTQYFVKTTTQLKWIIYKFLPENVIAQCISFKSRFLSLELALIKKRTVWRLSWIISWLVSTISND